MRELLVDVAMGYAPADTIITQGQIVNVNVGRIVKADIAIKNGRVACMGDVEYAKGPKTSVISAEGKYLVPGLIDAHFHQWHTYLNSTVFAQLCLLHGVTAVADGIYGPAIVAGKRGTRFFLDEWKATPVKPIFLSPTLCYTQNTFIGYPKSPNAPTKADLFEMLNWPECKGVEETGYDLILDKKHRDPVILELLEKALSQGKVIMAHGANYPDDRSLNGHIAAGVMSNHEIISKEEITKQAELGLRVHIREGSSCEDLANVIPAITHDHYNTRAFEIVTDVAEPNWLINRGPVNNGLRQAIKHGLDPIAAIQMCTIQPAEFYRVNHEIGCIAPGRFADVLFVDDLAEFSVSAVMASGEIWVRGHKFVRNVKPPKYPKWLYETMNVSRTVRPKDFEIRVPGRAENVRARVIGIRNGSLVTEELFENLTVRDGVAQPDLARGINKVAMVDRIFGTGETGNGFVKGFSLKAGCIGNTANVFNQNILLVGTNSEDMAFAANRQIELGGGFVAVKNKKILAEFPTPLLGLCTDLQYEEVTKKIPSLMRAFRELGCTLETPFTALEFITLCTIDKLKICTKGYARIEGTSFELVDLVA